ncbi:MAG: helix-turn-helix transcriptional regulator [Fusobacteriaceae bacterium]
MSKIVFIDPKILDEIFIENISSHKKHSNNYSIAQEKKNLILEMIFSSEYKIHKNKFTAYNLYKMGLSHGEIAIRLKISEQTSRNYKAEVIRKILDITAKLNSIELISV